MELRCRARADTRSPCASLLEAKVPRPLRIKPRFEHVPCGDTRPMLKTSRSQAMEPSEPMLQIQTSQVEENQHVTAAFDHESTHNVPETQQETQIEHSPQTVYKHVLYITIHSAIKRDPEAMQACCLTPSHPTVTKTLSRSLHFQCFC